MTDDLGAWFQCFGRLHPMVLHLPIGLLAGLAALETIAWIRPAAVPRPMGVIIAWLVALSAVLAAATGYIFSQEDATGSGTLTWHLRLGIAVAVTAVLMAAACTASRQRAAYRLLLVIVLGLIIPTGHLGASMVYGPRFLTQPLSAAAKPPAASQPGALRITSEPAELPPGLPLQVASIFNDRCTTCHGADLQKGGLALHTAEAVARGGKHGAIVVFGKPADAPIIRRLRLPVDDRQHMPPAEKSQLTEAQIGIIEHWIASSTSFSGPALVVPSPAPRPPKSGLPSVVGTRGAIAPADDTPPADPAAIAALRQHLVHVAPITQDSNRLSVDFAAVAARLDDATATLLLEPVITQLEVLSLGRSAVGDTTAALLSRATALRDLDLQRHADHRRPGFHSLACLTNLQQLVLVQTHLTDAAVEPLYAMPSLKRLYLWKSGVSQAGISRLRQQRPALYVDAGDSPGATTQEAEPEIKLTSDAPPPGQAAAVSLEPVNRECPVTGKPIDTRYLVVYQNRVIGFCCPHCPEAFWADPAKFQAKLPQTGAPVTGK